MPTYDMVEDVVTTGHPRAPLHLKVLAYHRNRVAAGQALPLQLFDLKTVLMPRQWFLMNWILEATSPLLT